MNEFIRVDEWINEIDKWMIIHRLLFTEHGCITGVCGFMFAVGPVEKADGGGVTATSFP